MRTNATVTKIVSVMLLVTCAHGTAAQTRALETCADGEPTTVSGLPDDDADGVANAVDNCVHEANANQRDADGDGIGSICDADLDNNGIVNSVDLGLMKSVFFSNEPGLSADLDGDGVVAPEDLAIMRRTFHQAPGPVGACLANPASCEGPVDFEFDDVGEAASGNLFVFRSSDPATIYHARRLISGASQCNPNISAYTFLGKTPWNSQWDFHIDGEISFHGSSVEPLDECDQTADFVQANLNIWCNDDTESTACRFWCPWRSRLTREL